MEQLIVAVIVAAAAIHVGRRALGVLRSARREDATGCGTGCNSCGPAEPATEKLVQLRIRRD